MSNEEFDTFDEPAAGDEKVSVSELLHNNPSLKIFAIVAVVGIIIAGILLFTGGEDELPVSRITQGSQVTEAPGGQQQASPAYEEAVRQVDERRLEEAIRTGRSALPTPRAKSQERIEAPDLESEEDDPLKTWRNRFEEEESSEADQRRDRELIALTEALEAEEEKAQEAQDMQEMNERTANQAPAPIPQIPMQNQNFQPVSPPLPSGPTEEQIQARSQQILSQMQTILETRVPAPSELISLGAITPEQLGINQMAVQEVSQTLPNNNEADIVPLDSLEDVDIKPDILPGDIAYAQMLTQANSDVPGPVLAYIASGPLAGARAIGSFSSTDEFLTITFETAVLDREQYAINAYAIDPQTTLTGMATDVNNHYISRIVLPAAAAFIEGFADAVAEQGSTTVTVNNETVTTETEDLDTEEELYEGLGEGIGEIADVIDEEADQEPTVTVDPGTRFGMLFLQPVFIEQEDTSF